MRDEDEDDRPTAIASSANRIARSCGRLKRRAARRRQLDDAGCWMLDTGWLATSSPSVSSIQHRIHMTVRTRFAPSPTGYLHIGGVRTALFQLAVRERAGRAVHSADRRHRRAAERGGSACADPARAEVGRARLGRRAGCRRAVTGRIINRSGWRSIRRPCRQLLEVGAAYRDFAKTEELQAERDAAQKAGRPFVYSRRWRAETDADARRFEAEGRQGVVRLLMPREGQFVLERSGSRRSARSIGRASRTTSFSGRTARACITWRRSSTITTCRFRT